jgi:hypothetical protein
MMNDEVKTIRLHFIVPSVLSVPSVANLDRVRLARDKGGAEGARRETC